MRTIKVFICAASAGGTMNIKALNWLSHAPERGLFFYGAGALIKDSRLLHRSFWTYRNRLRSHKTS